MTSLFAEGKFRLDKSPAGSETLIAFFDQSGNPSFAVTLSVIGSQTFLGLEQLNPDTYTQYDITSSIQANTWYSVALSLTPTSITGYFNDQAGPTIHINTENPTIKSVAVGMFFGTGTYGIYTGNMYVDNIQIGTLSNSPSPTPSASPTPSTSPTPTITGTTPTPTPSTTVLPTNSNPISINRLPESLEVGGPAISILAALGLVLANPQFFGRTKW